MNRVRTRSAFTLVELLVAIAVFTIMGVMVASLTDGAMRTARQSQSRMSVDAGARQALDRISTDLAHAVLRADAPFRIDKVAGNDQLAFVADADGYDAGRGLSMIGYRVANGQLERGAAALSWNTSGTGAMFFCTEEQAAAVSNYLTIPDAAFESVCPDVFRFEIAFLMADGSVIEKVGTKVDGEASTYISSFVSERDSPAAEKIKALIVGVAVLDGKNRARLGDGDLDNLALRFHDAQPGGELASQWANFLEGGDGIPPAARSAVRFYQRIIYLK